jgi:hypothetical protein
LAAKAAFRGNRSRELRRKKLRELTGDPRLSKSSDLQRFLAPYVERLALDNERLEAANKELRRGLHKISIEYWRMVKLNDLCKKHVEESAADELELKVGIIRGGWVGSFDPLSLKPLGKAGERRELDVRMLAEYVTTLLQIRRMTDENIGATVLKGMLARGSHPKEIEAELTEPNIRALKTWLADIALKLASELFRALADWAIDHRIGMELIAGADHDDRVDDDRVNGHRFELAGLNNRWKLQTLPSCQFSAWLLMGLLARLYPSAIALHLNSAMHQVVLGEEATLFRPKHLNEGKKGGHHRPAVGWTLRQRAIGHYYRRVALGTSKTKARESVANAYGVEADNVRIWEKRLPEIVGNTIVDGVYDRAGDLDNNDFGDLSLSVDGELYRRYQSKEGLTEIELECIFPTPLQ